MDSLFFIDFNSINFSINSLYSFINYSNYLIFLNSNYILFNLLIIVLIVYPLVTKYYLITSLKKLLNNIYLVLSQGDLEFYFLSHHFFHNLFFWVKKKSFIRLTFRLFEVHKESKEKYRHRKVYILWQYIDFFYVKIVLDYFYSLVLRLSYFSFIFILKYLFFIFKLVSLKVLFKFNLFNILSYVIYYILNYLLSINKNYISKIFNVINYIKLELFIYTNNENNFFGGLFLYIYNSLSPKIGIFNNFKNWQTTKLPNAKITNKIFTSWYYIIKYTYILNYNIFSYTLKYLINFLSISVSYFYLLKNIKSKNRLSKTSFKYINNIKNYTFLYLGCGFIYYLILDLCKSILYYLIVMIYNTIFKLRYIILIFLLYQLGLIYIFYVGFIYYLTYFLEDSIYIVLFQSISTIYNFYDIIIDRTSLIDSNEGLCNAWVLKYEELLVRKRFNKFNTLIGKLTLLNLRTLDLNNLNLTSMYDSTKILKSSVLMYTWKKFFSNIFHVIYMEISTYLVLKYYFFLYNHIKIYKIYLLFISDVNIYYYLIKKLFLIYYLIRIYFLMYLKFLYFYILPYYFLLSIILNLYNLVNSIWSILLLIICILYYLYNISMKILYIFIVKLLVNLTIVSMNIKSLCFYLYVQTIIIYLTLEQWLNLLKLNIYFNVYDVYINLLVDKLLLLNKFKEVIINYLRLNIFNLLSFKYNSHNILGNKVIAHTQFNLEELDFIKLRKSGLNRAQMEQALIQDKLYKKYRDIFSYTNRLYIYNNIYFLYINYTNNIDYWDWLHYKDFWIFNMYIKNIIFYYIIDLYIIFYLLFFILFKKLLNINIFKANNVEYLWYDLKKNLDYKTLNNDKFFMKALYYHQKIHGKIKLSNKIYKFLDINWGLVNKIKLNNLKLNNLKMKLFKNLTLGLNSSYIPINSLNNSSWNNFVIEKNMYSNNFFQFYWKNLVMFNSLNNEHNFIENYEDGKNYSILNFFLSLVFTKTRNSTQIFFYFENSNKNFYWNNNYNKFFYRAHDIFTNYFRSIESWLKLSNNNSLLHKDSSLVLFKDEDKNFSDMYSLNYNVNIPKYLFEFFWVAFMMYILIFKFRNKFVHIHDMYSIYVRITYLKMILINNNFMYFYDIMIYWFNYIFMFDMKNMGYEQHDFKHHLSKTKRYYRRIRPSNLFIMNNDPLYFFKKNYAYHLRYYNNINHSIILSSLNITFVNSIKFWLNLIIFIVCYKNLYINYSNNKMNIYFFVNIINVYRRNIIKYYSYLLKKK